MCLGRQWRPAGGVEVVEAVRLNGPDPETYLRDVIGRIAECPIARVAEFLPSNPKRSAP
jgi:hypothetical protein